MFASTSTDSLNRKNPNNAKTLLFEENRKRKAHEEGDVLACKIRKFDEVSRFG
jgi:hypothetical protein